MALALLFVGLLLALAGAVVVARRRAADPRSRGGAAGAPAADPHVPITVVRQSGDTWTGRDSAHPLGTFRVTTERRIYTLSQVASHYAAIEVDAQGRVTATRQLGAARGGATQKGPPVIVDRGRGEVWEVGSSGGVVAVAGDAIAVGLPIAAGAVATIFGGPEAGAAAAAGAGLIVGSLR